jgi:hypothetical protein
MRFMVESLQGHPAAALSSTVKVEWRTAADEDSKPNGRVRAIV